MNYFFFHKINENILNIKNVYSKPIKFNYLYNFIDISNSFKAHKHKHLPSMILNKVYRLMDNSLYNSIFCLDCTNTYILAKLLL